MMRHNASASLMSHFSSMGVADTPGKLKHGREWLAMSSCSRHLLSLYRSLDGVALVLATPAR